MKVGILIHFNHNQKIFLHTLINSDVKTRNENDKAFRKKNEKVTGFVGELVRGARDIKMLNAENSFTRELTEMLRKNRFDQLHRSQTARTMGHIDRSGLQIQTTNIFRTIDHTSSLSF